MHSTLLESLDTFTSMGVIAPASIDIESTSCTCNNKQFSLIPDPTSPRIPTNELPFNMQYCKENNWVVRRNNSGYNHVFDLEGRYIGEQALAEWLHKVGVCNPRPPIGTELKVCLIGKSNLLGKWVSWAGGKICFGDSEEAVSSACISEINEVTSILKLADFISSTMNVDLSSFLSNKEAQYVKDVPEVQEAQQPVEGSPRLESEGDDGSPNTNGDNTYKVPVGLKSGEHRQHNIYKPSRIADSNMPQSGDHEQHNIKGFNENPGYRMPRVEGHASLSAAINVQAFSWMKYAGARKTTLKHAKYSGSTIEDGEVFGYRAMRNGMYSLRLREDTTVDFRVDEKTMQRIIKVSKPFRGKIDGQAVLKVATTPEPVDAKKAKAKPEVDSTPVKLFLGFAQLSQFKLDMNVFVCKTNNEAHKLVKDAVSRNKNSVPQGFVLEMMSDDPFIQRIGSKANPRISKRVFDKLAQRYTSRRISMGTKMAEYTQTLRRPKESIKPTVPKIEPLAAEIMREIYDAILRDHFSVEYKPVILRKGKPVEFDKGGKGAAIIPAKGEMPTRLVLAAKNSTPLFRAEAEDVIARLRDVYGNNIRGKVGEYPDGDDRYTIVTIGLVFNKRPDAQNKRCRRLYEMWLNRDRSAILHTTLNRIRKLNEEVSVLSKAGRANLTHFEQAKLSQLLDNIKSAQADIAKHTSEALVMDAPVYKIKIGNNFVVVEVKAYNIVEGTVSVRAVRGNNKTEESDHLYDYSEKQIF